MRQLERIRTTLSIFTISSLIFISNAENIQAELAKSTLRRVRFVQSPLVSNTGKMPGRRRGASSRGSCPTPNPDKPLTAIVPATLMGKTKTGVDPLLTTWQSVGGLTSVARPDFVFYIPKEFSASPKEFVLQDSTANNIYHTSFVTAASMPAGFTQIRPTISLEVNKIYRWFFLVNCDNDAPITVSGWIQRIALAPVLEQRLQKANPQQQAQVFAANGIWYDALNNLIELRRANPENVTLLSSWVDLLDSVGLKKIAAEPVSQALPIQKSKASRLKPVSH